MKKTLAETLRTKPAPTAPHLIIEARAGTGKTTTLVEALKILRCQATKFTPSPQQDAIWKAVCESSVTSTACFVAFNKSIAMELQQRVPAGCDAMTMHSMGYKAIRGRFDTFQMNKFRVQDIISDLLGKDIHEIRRYQNDLLQATEKLVGLCKMNLVGFKSANPEQLNDDLQQLATHYDIEMNGNQRKVFDLIPKVLERCKDVEWDKAIDYNDMIWLPVVLDLHVQRYDILLVDEAQDLNRCQQQLALKAGRRLILCGDTKQAIYGFAGADSESMSRMVAILEDRGGCTTLPLTVTRRCGKAIVKEAQKYVPDFEAHEDNPEGVIGRDVFKSRNRTYHESVEDGDMLLCRVNAPLVSECFRFIRDGRRANIQGRDVGAGLIRLVKKVAGKEPNIFKLHSQLSEWLHLEQRKENAKRNPSDTRLIAMQDKHDCIDCFTEGQTTVDGVIAKIESIFTDDKESTGIMLSSVHKAKGLEARRVFLLQPEGATIPHPMAKSKWERDQEYNILYVAITRAIEELIYVS